ncbi:hypothetical protein [Marivita sp. S2033]|uniref:hypothetical protein n=1 Tax=Marivita sp. S2033 TaxID=3373187 RepID=UPI003981D84F
MRCSVLILLLFGLAGCFGPVGGTIPVVTTDFRYSNAGGFGTQNAGFLSPGQMFVWDIQNNELEPVTTLQIPLTSKSPATVAGRQSSTGVSGLNITGIPSELSGQEAVIEASIAAQSTYSVVGASRENYSETLTAAAEFIRTMVAAGENPDLVFHPRDDNYRIVIINSVLRARNVNLSVGGIDATDSTRIVEISLNSPIGEVGSLKIRSGANTTCGAEEQSDQYPACFFSVLIRDPHYEPGNPLLQFRVKYSPKERLPEAFRRLR